MKSKMNDLIRASIGFVINKNTQNENKSMNDLIRAGAKRDNLLALWLLRNKRK